MGSVSGRGRRFGCGGVPEEIGDILATLCLQHTKEPATGSGFLDERPEPEQCRGQGVVIKHRWPMPYVIGELLHTLQTGSLDFSCLDAQ
ncbi:hypothetical protein AWC04_08570 [Mycolicibacterium fallax]|uniref:Uncharacterized protein n=1 Tax=Mycolicibacterium fallax TaxID=1793 RepID=A0A1X1RG00_MYCFA|nr:hypothetical protein AWC04_08570 [Mycolicibacterium fallax]